MKLSVILPARNEERYIEKATKDIWQYLKKKKYPFEILIVVNGSFDSTEAKVKALSSKYPQIKFLKSKPGYGFALRMGMAKASGDYVVIFNVDFYDFRLVDLADKDLNGNDVIIGSKLARRSRDIRPFPRRMVSLLFNYYLKILYGFKGTDTHGIKIIKRKVIKKVLPECKITSGIFDTEFVLKSVRRDFKLSDIPVSVKEIRPSRFSKRLLQTPFDIYNLYRAMKGYKRLQFVK